MSSQLPAQGGLASRGTKGFMSALTATYSITWSTLNLTDTRLSYQARIFYQERHSRKYTPETQLSQNRESKRSSFTTGEETVISLLLVYNEESLR